MGTLVTKRLQQIKGPEELIYQTAIYNVLYGFSNKELKPLAESE